MIVINTWQYGKSYPSRSELTCKFEHFPTIPDLSRLNQEFRENEKSAYSGITLAHCDHDPRLVYITVYPDGLPRLKECLEKLQDLDTPQAWIDEEVPVETIAENNVRLYGIVQEFNCTRPMKWEVD